MGTDPASGTRHLGTVHFDDDGLAAVLEAMADDDLDDLDFGVIRMDRSGRVTGYNRDESRRSGLPPEQVLNRNFFLEIGPCTNNYLVSERFRTADELDEQLDYVFTFRMRPTPVRLRLVAGAGSAAQFLVVRSR